MIDKGRLPEMEAGTGSDGREQKVSRGACLGGRDPMQAKGGDSRAGLPGPWGWFAWLLTREGSSAKRVRP